MVAAAAPGYEKFQAESCLPTDVTVQFRVSFAAERQPGRLIAQQDLPVLFAAHPHARPNLVREEVHQETAGRAQPVDSDHLEAAVKRQRTQLLLTLRGQCRARRGFRRRYSAPPRS